MGELKVGERIKVLRAVETRQGQVRVMFHKVSAGKSSKGGLPTRASLLPRTIHVCAALVSLRVAMALILPLSLTLLDAGVVQLIDAKRSEVPDQDQDETAYDPCRPV